MLLSSSTINSVAIEVLLLTKANEGLKYFRRTCCPEKRCGATLREAGQGEAAKGERKKLILPLVSDYPLGSFTSRSFAAVSSKALGSVRTKICRSASVAGFDLASFSASRITCVVCNTVSGFSEIEVIPFSTRKRANSG